ncbi:hypothetical protein V6N12_000906 [Hibiscus sabdariffa]|uniref:Uncharacterized protein n=1 Tax=Hibiscus sabdariffa TaxID=183260 RepID=A0ABR2BXV8_9ROSI
MFLHKHEASVPVLRPNPETSSYREYMKPLPEGLWTTGICECYGDVSNCLFTGICPCVTMGRNYEIVNRGEIGVVLFGWIFGSEKPEEAEATLLVAGVAVTGLVHSLVVHVVRSLSRTPRTTNSRSRPFLGLGGQFGKVDERRNDSSDCGTTHGKMTFGLDVFLWGILNIIVAYLDLTFLGKYKVLLVS